MAAKTQDCRTPIAADFYPPTLGWPVAMKPPQRISFTHSIAAAALVSYGVWALAVCVVRFLQI